MFKPISRKNKILFSSLLKFTKFGPAYNITDGEIYWATFGLCPLTLSLLTMIVSHGLYPNEFPLLNKTSSFLVKFSSKHFVNLKIEVLILIR